VGNLVFTLAQARNAALQTQFAASEKLARILEQQTTDSINALELALQALANAALTPPRTQADPQAAMQELLAMNIRNQPFVRAIWILDVDGNMVHDSERLPGKYNLADRDYFKVHRDRPTQGLYIEGPIKSKHGVWFIGVSQRITAPDGSFGGVVAAAFEPKHFVRFYQSIRLGDTGVVALLRSDGTTLIRVPDQPDAGARLRLEPPLSGTASGSVRARSGIDGIERIYAYRQIPERPLTALIGIGVEEALAPWRSTAVRYATVSAALLLALAVLGFVALRELRIRNALHEVLVQSEADLAAAQRLSRTGSWTYEFPRNIGQWSDEMYALLGLEKGSGAPPLPEFLSRIHQDDRAQVEHALLHEDQWALVVRTNPDLGPMRFLHSQGEVLRDRNGVLVGKAGTLQDITERHEQDEKLRLAACVFDRMQDGIVVTDLQGAVLMVNRACETMTEYTEQEVLGKRASIFLSEPWHSTNDILQSVAMRGEWLGETWGKRKNGALYPLWLSISAIQDTQGRQTGYVGVFTDLSDIRDASEQLDFLSFHDPLTRLPNRRLILDRLQQELDQMPAEDHITAALVLNVDRLQRVNDTFGHEVGNAVLVEISRRLPGAMTPGDSVGRTSGDVVVVVLASLRDTTELITITHRLLDAISRPIEAGGHTLSITASAGIAVFPADARNAEDLLKNGATALSHAKQRGPGTMRFYASAMNAQAVRWTRIEQELRRAQLGTDVTLHYQPQICIDDGRICGAEALMRWQSSELGSVSPAEFIPVAEDAGLIEQFGDWAIGETCRQARLWLDKGIGLNTIAVNVSSHQFRSGALIGVVQRALHAHKLAPEMLEIELTESALMRESDIVCQQIAGLRKIGVRVSLDDFGTGYSSLSYLSKFEFDKIKIDQSFVRNVPQERRSEAIALATVALAKSLDMDVIAEGVENAGQLRWLGEIGCGKAQGYFISRPVPAEQLERIYLDNGGVAASYVIDVTASTK
jgi:diguanylate cyclase (GGDEF)-like protein/PAS domain S-box-containing protein